MSKALRNFLDLRDMDKLTLRNIITKSHALKTTRTQKSEQLQGRKLAMIFEKNSTRTRVSFEVGMIELGGHALSFSNNELQLGRGESIADTARVLSRYVDAIMLRCHEHKTLLELATHATVPVINGLSDETHPCQIMADILTFEEKRGNIAGKVITWVGDGNNMAASWIVAAAQFGFELRLACPKSLMPDVAYIQWAEANGAKLFFTENPKEAVKDADAVVTDAWISMGDKDEDAKKKLLAAYQVNAALMAEAKSEAIFMHCLPAHRGEEVTDEVVDGPQSVVWDEAENRLHVQKAILLWCMQAM